MTRILSLFVVFMLSGVLAFAQNRTVTGTVRDEKGAPVEAASVTVNGTRKGAKTDENGNYRLSNVAPNAVLEISGVGITTKTINTGSSIVVDIPVVRGVNAASDLNTVVVVGTLGRRIKAIDQNGGNARLTNADVNKAAPVNIANGLQGKVSGLNITSTNNGVFEDVKINLRGIRSLAGSNNPMLVLDGVPTPLGYLSSINPNDIADVNILKGASSAALYGPDAANGVIIVTTKRGSSSKPTITLSNTTQFSQISFFPKFQNEFGSGGSGSYTGYENWSWGDAFDGSIRDVGLTLPNGHTQYVKYSPLVNERKNFFNTGVTNQTDLSFSTKDFYMSVQDVKIKGIVPDDENRRTGIRMNAGRDFGKFRINYNINYIQQNSNVFDDDAMSAYNTTQNIGLNGGLMNLIFNTPAQIPITKYKDFKNDEFANYNGYYTKYGTNPYFAIDNWRQKQRSEDLLTNLDLIFKPTNWLSITYRAAANLNNTGVTSTSKGETPTSFGASQLGATIIPGSVSEAFARSSRLSSEIFAVADKKIGNFNLTVTLGQYVRQTDFRTSTVTAGNLVVPELFNVGNRTGELGGSGSFSRTRSFSYYGEIGLKYKDFLNLNVTGRNDHVSILDPKNQSLYYPGVGGSFIITNAFPSLKSNVLSLAKIRATHSKTGNTGALGVYALDAIYGQASGFPYGSLPGFTAGNTTTDRFIKPEYITGTDAGIDLAFWKNRITVGLGWFYQNNTDQIIPVRVSTATGYTNSQINAASFINKGYEFDLGLAPLIKIGTVEIGFNGNATYNNSEVKRLAPGLDQLFIGGFDNFAANYAITGAPAFVFKATDWVRDDQGHVIVSSTTGRPTLDPNSKVFGRTQPLWTVGLTPNVQWKNFTFSATVEYKAGHYVYNNIGADMAWTGVSAATAVNHRERFVFPNSVIETSPGKYETNTSVVVNDVNTFFTEEYRDVATNFLTSADSWRVREVSLSYRFPESILSHQKLIKGVTFTINARNLFLWVPKSNEYSDPDFTFSTGNSSGVQTSQINPPTRMVGANLTVTF